LTAASFLSASIFRLTSSIKIGDVDDLADSRQKLMANLDFDNETE